MERVRQFVKSPLTIASRAMRAFNYDLSKRVSSRIDQKLATPGPDRQALIEKEIELLNVLLAWGKFANTSYFYHYQIGRCYFALEQRIPALSHFEQALLLHPNPDNIADFQVYSRHYLVAVRVVSQKDGISNLRGRNRLIGVQNLEGVLKSTRRILEKYPFIEEVGRERLAAGTWIQRAI